MAWMAAFFIALIVFWFWGLAVGKAMGRYEERRRMR